MGFAENRYDTIATFYRKEKRFVIADKMIDEGFQNRPPQESGDKRAMRLLLIDLSRDINKLKHDLHKADRVVDIHREKLKRYDNNVRKMSWFDRVFRYKKALKRALS
jgi:hypothetical protein